MACYFYSASGWTDGNFLYLLSNFIKLRLIKLRLHFPDRKHLTKQACAVSCWWGGRMEGSSPHLMLQGWQDEEGAVLLSPHCAWQPPPHRRRDLHLLLLFALVQDAACATRGALAPCSPSGVKAGSPWESSMLPWAELCVCPAASPSLPLPVCSLPSLTHHRCLVSCSGAQHRTFGALPAAENKASPH